MLFHDMAVPDGWDVASDELIQPKVEAEIAFVIGRDLDNEHLTIADILRAVEFALPAIEIVDSRISDCGAPSAPSAKPPRPNGRSLACDPRHIAENLRVTGFHVRDYSVPGFPTSGGPAMLSDEVISQIVTGAIYNCLQDWASQDWASAGGKAVTEMPREQFILSLAQKQKLDDDTSMRDRSPHPPASST